LHKVINIYGGCPGRGGRGHTMRSLAHAPRNHHLRGTHGKGTSPKKGEVSDDSKTPPTTCTATKGLQTEQTFCMQATKSLVPIPQYRTDRISKRRVCSAHGWHAFSKWRVSISSMTLPHLDHSYQASAWIIIYTLCNIDCFRLMPCFAAAKMLAGLQAHPRFTCRSRTVVQRG
jgi:hypothetical protein